MQTRIVGKDVWLLIIVSLMALGANLPDTLAGNVIDRHLLLEALTATVFISLFRYLRVMLFLTVSVLAIGANLPEALASQLHISPAVMIVASGALVVVALLYKFYHQIDAQRVAAHETGDALLDRTVENVAVSHFRDTFESRLAVLSSIMKGDLAALHQLLISDVEVNFSQDGHIPLLLAVERGNADIVLLLLIHGAKLKIKNQQGMTPIDLALKLKFARVAKILHYASTQNMAIQNRALYSSQQTRKMAVLFADVCDSTALYDQLGNEAALNMITRTLHLLKHEVAQHRGSLIKTIGDEIMCTFPNPALAVQAACAMQKAVDAGQPGGEHPIAVRIGLHFGDVILKANDVYGDTVNVAARIASITRARQIMTTQEVIAALPDDFEGKAVPISRASLRGKQDALAVFQLLWESESAASERVGGAAMRKFESVVEDRSERLSLLGVPEAVAS